MVIECANCKKHVTVPEDILKSGKLQFICHLCNTKQEIITIKIMQEKTRAGKLKVFFAGNPDAVHDLFVGKNLVGRNSDTYKSDIEFSKDGQLSRQHFILEVCENRHGSLEYLACYNNARKVPNARNVPVKTTIVSGTTRMERELNPSEKIILSDGDKIVAGKTTFILEKEKNSIQPQKPPGEGTKGGTVLVQ